jgi:isopentenyl diphosphate isomerase/L-lactate dehydrogenase-like FMN-dependent dehydrogenase
MTVPAADATATPATTLARESVAVPPAVGRNLAERYLNIEDLRRAAKRRLPKGVFEFFDRGSEDEVSLAENRAAFRRIKMRNKVLVDVSTRSTQMELFGKPMAMPLAIAPTGIAGLTWYEGELELAKAAQRFGVPFTLATPSITAIESIARVEGGRNWFQLYMWRDREASYSLVKRARDAGFEALILTVDTQVSPIREYNRRNGFNSPFTFNWKIAADVALHPGWLVNVLWPYLRTTGMPRPVHYPRGAGGRATSGLSGVAAAMRGDDLSWDDIARLRELWPGPIMIKGVHLPEDAERAVAEGLDGVIISNHGGRNLDGAVSPIEVLPEIVAAVGTRTNVLIDSGIRRGSDVLKAIALGAKAVLSGRCTLYGTSVAGQDGALHALNLLRKELDTSMAYTGCRAISEIGPRAVWLGPERG